MEEELGWTKAERVPAAMTKMTQRVMVMVMAERRQTVTEEKWQRGLQSDRAS